MNFDDDGPIPEEIAETLADTAHDNQTPAPEPSQATDPDERGVRLTPLRRLELSHRSWTNPRSISGLDDTSIGELAASIAAMTYSGGDDTVRVIAGVEMPLEVVTVERNGDHIDLVIDGQRRLMAMRSLGLPPDTLVRVIDLEPEPVDTWTTEHTAKYLRRSLGMVTTRRGLSSVELVRAAASLRAAKNPDTGREHTLLEIGAVIGKTDSWVSKLLKAMDGASPSLLNAWEQGRITDEQFKDLARAAPSAQSGALKEVLSAIAGGDATRARAIAKEQVIHRRQAEADKAKADAVVDSPEAKTKAKAKSGASGPVVRGPQLEIKPVRLVVRPTDAELSDLIAMTVKRPPTHEYVRGVIDGIRFATGRIGIDELAKPWRSYRDLVAGDSPSKKPKKSKKK